MRLKGIKLIKLFFVSLLCLISSISFSQVNEGFAGYGDIKDMGLVSPGVINFEINGFFGNNRPRQQDSYTTYDMQVGDLVLTTDCNLFTIASITFNTGTVIRGTLVNNDLNQSRPTSNTRVAVLRATKIDDFYTYSLPPSGDGNGGAISGITTQMKACLETHFKREDSIAVTRAREVYQFNAGAGISPPLTPAASRKRLAYNLSTDEFWKAMGSTWSLIGASGGGGTTYSASNGISLSGTTFKLGGLIRESTLIDAYSPSTPNQSFLRLKVRQFNSIVNGSVGDRGVLVLHSDTIKWVNSYQFLQPYDTLGIGAGGSGYLATKYELSQIQLSSGNFSMATYPVTISSGVRGLVVGTTGITATLVNSSTLRINVPANGVLTSFTLDFDSNVHPGTNLTLQVFYAANTSFNTNPSNALVPNLIAMNTSALPFRIASPRAAASTTDFNYDVQSVSGGNITLLINLTSSLNSGGLKIKALF